MSSGSPLLEFRNVAMRFGGVTALNTVDISVHKGEIAALIGPNGAGKTTVFNIVTGVYQPTEGEVLFHSARACANISKHPALCRDDRA
jgi:branched-chain amino acid transport system ATP-binding protein